MYAVLDHMRPSLLVATLDTELVVHKHVRSKPGGKASKGNIIIICAYLLEMLR